MKKFLKQFIYLAILILLLILPFFVFASTTMDSLSNVALRGGYSATDEYGLSKFVGTVINTFFSLLGTIFIVLMLYAGFKWMKASGREEEVKAAQDIIRRAIIGLIVTVSAYTISEFVFKYL